MDDMSAIEVDGTGQQDAELPPRYREVIREKLLDPLPIRVTTLFGGRFVEAFMVGLNHEMNHELVWRTYPTDQRGTPFRRFFGAPPHLHARRTGNP